MGAGEVKKAVAISIVIILILNLILLAAGRIHLLQFWIVVIFAAIFAFIILPRNQRDNTKKG